MPKIAIIIGSETDLAAVDKSGIKKILDEFGVSWELSIISAHRNPEQLRDYCLSANTNGVKVIIAAAGMAAVLPTTVASWVKYSIPVIGIGLPSDGFPKAEDACMAMSRRPPGCPMVAYDKIGEVGLKEAAILALQILGTSDDIVSKKIRSDLATYTEKNAKPSQIAKQSSEKKGGEDGAH